MSSQCKEFGISLGYAAAGLAIASAGVGMSALATAHGGVLATPVIMDIALTAGKKMLGNSHDHLKIALHGDSQPEVDSKITLTRK